MTNKPTMGSKRVTSQDVAKHAGVSRSVVSAVLNGTRGIGVSAQTREIVLASIAELNYQVDAQARSMKTGRSMTIAAFGDTAHPLFIRLLEGMQRAGEREGYHLLLCSPKSGENREEDREGRHKLLDLYRQRKIDGIVTLDDTSYADSDWADEVRRIGVPYVSVEGYAEENSISSVHADYRGSMETALDYLTERYPELTQAQKIAPEYAEIESAALGGKVNWAEQQRKTGYLDWCSRRNLKPHATNLLQQNGHVNWDNWLQVRAEQHARPVLVNWSSAVLDLYRIARRFALEIGEDLPVMAADNTIHGDRLSVPTLSCMEIPYADMGRAAVEILLRRIEGETDRPAKMWLPAILKPGESA
ncbi:LacI family DNA-binding transcriptional regulator [Saccharibacillus kuerlensis]|uniref:LacI family transcriptional regulator n=1 Tax=Saccharibacillus kuerlensis TaxID=459527 RepID=A0ABQ2L979_9BACL|nr:LacI family DNA-binding transcriptional regulator [Saccharibacillus kuerlensis]GGO07546.1 LacI family transcriptional regulator [Saccharibacillus kuerlensis]